ncbi:MAG: SH3 domain-containing protein [Elainellaceae cyanobacterium]
MARRWLGRGAIALLKTAIFGIAMASLPTAASGSSIANPDSQTEPTDRSGNLLLAQANGICREVASDGGLYVREAPSPYSEAIAALPRGAQVTVQTLDADTIWVPVSGPVSGFMSAPYLVPCGTTEAAAVPSGTGICRQVLNEGGLYVREAPSPYSEAIAALPMGAQVTVQVLESAGWVPVSAPQPGYMFAAYLGACG